MCKVCDKQRQFAEMVVDCLRRPDPDMSTFRAIDQAGVIIDEWRTLVLRGIDIVGAADIAVAQAAVRVVRAVRLDALAADLAVKRGQFAFAGSEAARGLTILQELGDDDPFRNKARFEEINRPLWQRYFAHERETGLRPDIVGWIEGFCNRYYRPVIDQLVGMLTHRSLDVRVAVSAAVDRIGIDTLKAAADQALGRPVAQTAVSGQLVLPSQFGDEEWEAVLLQLDDGGSGEHHHHSHGSGWLTLGTLAKAE